MSGLTIGSLFSGIGGLELGLERAGLGPVLWQVEKNAYCRAVLAKHWPDTIRYEDVKDVGRANLRPVDVICGGFPCQDISAAGSRGGISGKKSGLWSEYIRIIRELRSRYVIVENVAALLIRGLDTVLRELAESGYDAEWGCVAAADVGALHRRDRVFIVAYPSSARLEGGSHPATAWARSRVAPTDHWWTTEPDVGRVAHGVPARVDRLRALGNAVVPQVAEVVGRVVMELETARLHEERHHA